MLTFNAMRLKEARIRLNMNGETRQNGEKSLTLVGLSKLTGFYVMKLSNFETGKMVPRANELAILAAALKVESIGSFFSSEATQNELQAV
jgi:hypothetical protein